MQESFKAYEKLFDNFELALETFPVKPGEDMIAYFERLMKRINNSKDDTNNQ
jgi:hypothetical protein